MLLLRAVNVGSSRRVGMPALREALGDAGFADVATYLQSGNVVLTSPLPAAEVAEQTSKLIEDVFGLDVLVAARGRAQLAEIVAGNPIPAAARDPKRYQVSFLVDGKPDAKALARAKELATDREQFVIKGDQLYAWHPDGIARSKLSVFLASRELGAVATARNWATVTRLLEMASE